MKAKRWSTIKRIFHEVDSLSPEEKKTRLRQLCQDSDLIEEIQWLLEADTGKVDFLGQDIKKPTSSEIPGEGQCLGPYRLLESLGQGGMGSVFLAVRDDGAYQKKVAIKTLAPWSNPGTAARFLRERQILADLDHPNIARLYDGGTTDEDLPYLVMEHVKGESLDQWYKKEPDLTTRLQIFQKICSAVHYAHQNLVVHRDLKPDNILVTAEGEPKLLDFGIAKLLENDGNRTQTGQFLMTPQYASPEQVEGKTVTTATDVYALGLLLFELLSDKKAQHIEHVSPEEVIRVVVWGNPFCPNSAAKTTQIVPYLQGDLEWIAKKALRKEPGERYASVLQLSEEIQNYQKGFPIAARQGDRSYYMRRFIKRNRAAVTGFSVFFLIILASLIGLTVLNRQILKSQRKAEIEKIKAEQTSDFLVDVFQSPDPYQHQGKPDISQILERASQNLLGQEENHSAHYKFMTALGKIYYNLGQFEDALPLLEKALRIMKISEESTVSEETTNYLALGETAIALGNFHKAREYFKNCMAKTGLSEVEKRTALQGLGEVAYWEGQYEYALEILFQILASQKKFSMPLEKAETYYNLGAVFGEMGLFIDSERCYLDALEIRTLALGAQHPVTSLTQYGLATNYIEMGELHHGAALLQNVMINEQETLGPCHPELGPTYSSLADVFRKLEQYEAAARLYKQALDIARHAYAPNHPEVGSLENNIALNYLESGELYSAEQHYINALDIFENSYGVEHHLYANVLTGLGKVHQANKGFSLAESLHSDALQIGIDVLGRENPQVIGEMLNLADLYYEWGRLKDADLWMKHTLTKAETHLPENHTILIQARLLKDLLDSIPCKPPE